MKRLRDWNPSSWDSKSNYAGDRSKFHWFVAPVILTRDADLLEESNWYTAVKMLNADKQAGVQIHNFGHWACGHYDIILIHPWNKAALKIAEEIESSLHSYPVLDEQDWSDREYEACQSAWEDWGWSDLNELLLERLNLDSETELTTDSWELVRLLESSHQLMTCDSGGVTFETELAREQLSRIEPVKLWELITDIEMKLSDFEALPHEIYHVIQAKKINVSDINSGEPLNIPDFIAVQYNKNQTVIPGTL